MRRREFISGLGGAAAWHAAARAQQQVLPVIGWLSSRNARTEAALLAIFWKGLNAQGYFENGNIRLEQRWADGRVDQLPALAAELIRQRISVVVTVGDGIRGAQAIQAVDRTVPVVFLDGANPFRSGLISSLNHPAGSVTGFMVYNYEIEKKRLGLLRELLPSAEYIAILANTKSYTQELGDVQLTASALGMRPDIMDAGNDRELNAVIANLAGKKAHALYVTTSPFFFARAEQIVASASRLAVPASYFRREFVQKGGLFSYGPNTDIVFSRITPSAF